LTENGKNGLKTFDYFVKIVCVLETEFFFMVELSVTVSSMLSWTCWYLCFCM